MKLHAVLLLLCLALEAVQSALISQSTISKCNHGDESEPSSVSGKPCETKFLVTMALKGGQGETDSLYANIDQAYQEGEREISKLKKPFRLEMKKSEVLASYRAYYQGSVNARPTETVIKRQTCRDGWYEDIHKLPCRKQLDINGNPVFDSQGFCCTCNGLNKLENRRGGHSCKLIGMIKRYGSAHCMKMDHLWYDVFELEQPMLQYNITLSLLEFNGIVQESEKAEKYVNWTTVSTFYLNPSQTMSRSKNGRVVGQVQGDLMGSKSLYDFSYKYLLIPSVLHWPNSSYPVQYTNGPGDWMLVDQHFVDLSGTECNRMGVDYSGFRRQVGKCFALPGSCFTSQPLDFWESDNIRRENNEQGHYMVHNFGKIHNSSFPNNKSFILKFIHEDLHNTFVTFRIDASDITFVYNVGSGRIVDTYASDFTALKGAGTLGVLVENTGEVTSEFSISVMKCNKGIHRIPAKSATIDPGKTANLTFMISSYNSKAGEEGSHKCEVQLYDSEFNMLQTAEVDFKVGSTCFCYGACGCSCDSDVNDGQVTCPEPPPPVIIKSGPIVTRAILLLLASIGAEGFIGFGGGILLFLGFIKLSCGGIICRRKTKAQEYAEMMAEKGAPPKVPMQVRCSGECQGAQAARERYKRKVVKLRKLGKSPHRLDDWRNTSFVCSCHDELTDIRFVHIIKSVCFFYYCFLMPLIWLGKKIYWGVFVDTADKQQKAEQAVLQAARKKGNLEKYGVVDLAAELKKFEEEAGEKGKPSKPSVAGGKAALDKALVQKNVQKGLAIENAIKQEPEKKLKKKDKKKSKKKDKKNRDKLSRNAADSRGGNKKSKRGRKSRGARGKKHRGSKKMDKKKQGHGGTGMDSASSLSERESDDNSQEGEGHSDSQDGSQHSGSGDEHTSNDENTGSEDGHTSNDENTVSEDGHTSNDENTGSEDGHTSNDENTVSEDGHTSNDENTGSGDEHTSNDENTDESNESDSDRDSGGSEGESADSEESDSDGSDSDGSDSDGSDNDGSDSDGSDGDGSDGDGSDSDGSDNDGSDNDGSDNDGSDGSGSDSDGSDSGGSDSGRSD